VSLQVCRRRPQHIGPILELPDAKIALSAQQAADLLCYVVVIDMCTTTHWENDLATHCTSLSLRFQ